MKRMVFASCVVACGCATQRSSTIAPTPAESPWRAVPPERVFSADRYPDWMTVPHWSKQAPGGAIAAPAYANGLPHLTVKTRVFSRPIDDRSHARFALVNPTDAQYWIVSDAEVATLEAEFGSHATKSILGAPWLALADGQDASTAFVSAYEHVDSGALCSSGFVVFAKASDVRNHGCRLQFSIQSSSFRPAPTGADRTSPVESTRWQADGDATLGVGQHWLTVRRCADEGREHLVLVSLARISYPSTSANAG